MRQLFLLVLSVFTLNLVLSSLALSQQSAGGGVNSGIVGGGGFEHSFGVSSVRVASGVTMREESRLIPDVNFDFRLSLVGIRYELGYQTTRAFFVAGSATAGYYGATGDSTRFSNGTTLSLEGESFAQVSVKAGVRVNNIIKLYGAIDYTVLTVKARGSTTGGSVFQYSHDLDVAGFGAGVEFAFANNKWGVDWQLLDVHNDGDFMAFTTTLFYKM